MLKVCMAIPLVTGQTKIIPQVVNAHGTQTLAVGGKGFLVYILLRKYANTDPLVLRKQKEVEYRTWSAKKNIFLFSFYQVEPATLESHVTQVKENIQLKMEKVQQRVKLQEEKYADLTDMPSGRVSYLLNIYCLLIINQYSIIVY